MRKILEDSIKEYNTVFVDSDKDLRVECEVIEDFTLECMALDGIQLCTYCIIGMTEQQPQRNLFNMYKAIEWKCIKRKNTSDYIFYPWISDNIGMKTTLRSLSVEQCSRCSYLEKLEEYEPEGCIEDFHNYKTCIAICASENPESVGIVTDIMVNMNRRGRNAEELEQLSKILCCCKLEIMHSFLDCMLGYLKNTEESEKAEEKNNLKEAIKRFYDDVVELRHKIDQGDYTVFQGLEETSLEVAKLLRERKKSGRYVLDDLYTSKKSFPKKIEDFFASGNKWKVKKKISGYSCEDYINKLDNGQRKT